MGMRVGTARVAQIVELLQSCIDRRAHFPGRLLHSQILGHGLSSDTFLNNKLIEFYAICGRLNAARRVFERMPHRNVYSWNGLLGSYCKAGLLDEAYQLFVRMPERNVVSWNTVISAMVRANCQEKALELYDMMVLEGFMPTHFTFASVLSACGALTALEDGRRCHALVIKVGLDGNMFVENGLVNLYAKCESIIDAIRIFDRMSQPNEVTCTAMMTGLAKTNHVEESFKMFTKMHRHGIRIDQVALSSVLGVCSRCDDELLISDQNFNSSGKSHGKQVHAVAIKLGCDQDIHVSNSLTDMYAKSGDIICAEKNFEASSEVSVVSWNVLIAGYGQHGLSDKAVELSRRMQLLGFEPDDVTYISLLAACVKSGDIETARQVFDKMLSPSVVSWNAMLSGYCQKGCYKEAVELFHDMQFNCVPPDRTTFAVILSSCAGIGFQECGKQVHAASTRRLLHSDVFVASGLVDMYSKCGDVNVAKTIFDRMQERDVVAWNSMMGCLALHSQSQEAFTFFKLMRNEGIIPTQFSYASLVSSCVRLSSLYQGRQVHGQIIKDGYSFDVFVGSTLIDMYAKSGNVDEARCVFDSMPTKNIVSWNEMIHGYAQNGYGERSVDLFEKMLKEGEKPDSVTFIAVLTACSHAGLVDSAIKYFSLMENDHGIQPLANHYACILDTLGRASRFEEAEVLLEKMPCKDDPIIWEILLSSCRVHANVKLGKQAAEELFRLDPKNSAPYVLLSNIYAAVGRWDDVSSVRKLMIDRGVVKDPGYSWVDLKTGVQPIMVDDDLRTVVLAENRTSSHLEFLAQNV